MNQVNHPHTSRTPEFPEIFLITLIMSHNSPCYIFYVEHDEKSTLIRNHYAVALSITNLIIRNLIMDG